MYRFHHIHILCSDLEKMLKFFLDTLGAQFVSARKFGGADGATLDLAGVPIYLRVAREGEKIIASPSANPPTAQRSCAWLIASRWVNRLCTRLASVARIKTEARPIPISTGKPASCQATGSNPSA